jgi:hypothetical protein
MLPASHVGCMCVSLSLSRSILLQGGFVKCGSEVEGVADALSSVSVERSEEHAEEFEDETAADDEGHECCDGLSG